MKKCLQCLAGVLLCYSPLLSQYYFYDANRLEPEWRIEAGFSLGLMNCLTDLGGHKGTGKKFIKDINWASSKACIGFFFGVTHRDLIGLRMEIAWGSVSSGDSILKNDASAASLRYARNLHFRSRIADASTLMEFHPLYLSTNKMPQFSPYLLMGIGYFHFQPEAKIEGAWVRLQPLHTEGQGFKEFPDREDYQLQQFNFPLGCGLKYDISGLLVLRMEFLYRILTTDYLDDVSEGYIDPTLFYRYFPPAKAGMASKLADRGRELDPLHRTTPGAIRGNPGNKDGFFSINLKFSFVLNRRRL